MPARPPQTSKAADDALLRLGARLRDERKRQGVTMVAAAEAAGLSRVTLHRIERGEPSVSIGAWIAVAQALGLVLDVADPEGPVKTAPLPKRIRLRDYPQLRKLGWQLRADADLTPREALSLYERNWRHVDVGHLNAAEAALIRALSAAFGEGRLLV